MTDESVAQPDTPSEPPASRKWRAPQSLPIALSILGGFIIVGLILAVALRPLLSTRTPEGIPLRVTRVTDSPTATLAPPPSSSSPPVAEIGGAQVTLPIPVRLDVDGESFAIETASLQEDGSGIVPSQADHAVWASGTVINYVFGLQPTPENQALLDRLASQSTIGLSLSNGTRMTFRFRERLQTAPGGAEALSQFRAGLTLITPAAETWSCVTADFEAASEPSAPSDAVGAPLAQAVQVGDARVIVMRGQAQAGEGAVGPGTMLFLVEYAITNSGSTTLYPNQFLMELVDAVGNRYPFSPSAARAGESGPLEAPIPPEETMEGTAGYVVPQSLVGPELTWVFGPDAASELRARFAIPYSPRVDSPAAPDVEIDDAFLGEQGSTLHVLAYISNNGATPLTVTAADVSLSSSAGRGELIIAAPPFPWTIEPDGGREVELQFVRPEASTAIVTILGFTFEISGLP